MLSIAPGRSDIEPLLFEALLHVLESLVFLDSDGSCVALILNLPGWILHVRLHEFSRRVLNRREESRLLREVVHEQVVTLLRVGPAVEYLRTRN